jgi:hypothetical protein
MGSGESRGPGRPVTGAPAAASLARFALFPQRNRAALFPQRNRAALFPQRNRAALFPQRNRAKRPEKASESSARKHERWTSTLVGTASAAGRATAEVQLSSGVHVNGDKRSSSPRRAACVHAHSSADRGPGICALVRARRVASIDSGNCDTIDKSVRPLYLRDRGASLRSALPPTCRQSLVTFAARPPPPR